MVFVFKLLEVFLCILIALTYIPFLVHYITVIFYSTTLVIVFLFQNQTHSMS